MHYGQFAGQIPRDNVSEMDFSAAYLEQIVAWLFRSTPGWPSGKCGSPLWLYQFQKYEFITGVILAGLTKNNIKLVIFCSVRDR